MLKQLNSKFQRSDISIIIPLYNTEKYIGQCLKSILNQTFKDYEVIVIDDCSTDKSVEEVEKWIPKFEGKLNLIKLKINSGNASLPRNVGITNATGKYIMFVDSDDLITSKAFEELYKIAEEFQADVLHTEKYFIPKEAVEEIDSNTKFVMARRYETGDMVNKPELESEDIIQRLKDYNKGRFFAYVWGKLFRRDLFIENDIRFPNMPISEDAVVSFYCTFLAKKYVRVPNVFYIYRRRNDSAVHKPTSIGDFVHRWFNVMSEGTEAMNRFMNRFKFFSQKPECKYMVLDYFIQDGIRNMQLMYKNVPAHVIYPSILKEFMSSNCNDNAFASYLLNVANIYYKRLLESQQKIIELEQKIKEIEK